VLSPESDATQSNPCAPLVARFGQGGTSMNEEVWKFSSWALHCRERDAPLVYACHMKVTTGIKSSLD